MRRRRPSDLNGRSRRRKLKYGVDPSTIPPRGAGLSRTNRENQEWLDRQSPLIRCLVGFYGFRPIGEALTRMNPEDVPARLGRREEFEEYWGEWQKIHAEAQSRSSATKEAAARALSSFFQ